MTAHLYTDDQIARREREAFLRGVWWAELATVRDDYNADTFAQTAKREAATRYPLTPRVACCAPDCTRPAAAKSLLLAGYCSRACAESERSQWD